MTKPIKKIAITGPESTGKSSLCINLAHTFDTVWVPEYAREYCKDLNCDYQLADIELIGRRQIEMESLYEKKANTFLFCDTDPIVLKVWAEHAFKTCPDWINEAIQSSAYTHYLLCNTDVQWEEDPLREHPHLRNYLFDWYQKILEEHQLPYTIIQGVGQARFDQATEIIKQL